MRVYTSFRSLNPVCSVYLFRGISMEITVPQFSICRQCNWNFLWNFNSMMSVESEDLTFNHRLLVECGL